MKIIYLIILSLLTQHGVMSQEIKSNDPSKLTIEFIKDYKKQNDYAYNLSQTKNNDENIEKEYKKVVGDKNVVGQMLDEGSVKIDETVPLILKKIL